MNFGQASPSKERVSKYLEKAELKSELSETQVAEYAAELAEFVKNTALQPLDNLDVESLFTYFVPALKADGCSRIDGTLEKDPYDLRKALGLTVGEDPKFLPVTRQLFVLDKLVEKVTNDTGVNWLGFYQRRSLNGSGEALVKLAYRGSESRAEFPLTKDFARKSNNTTVGLTGRGIVINDIERYLWEEGGPYYQCDSKVHSEACLPVYAGPVNNMGQNGGQIIGIIDAEAFDRYKFNEVVLVMLVATAVLLEDVLAPLD